jgi:hypothetical protein
LSRQPHEVRCSSKTHRHSMRRCRFLSNPENAEVLVFVQDYNFNEIPHTPENDRKFQKCRDIVNKGLGLKQ